VEQTWVKYTSQQLKRFHHTPSPVLYMPSMLTVWYIKSTACVVWACIYYLWFIFLFSKRERGPSVQIDLSLELSDVWVWPSNGHRWPEPWSSSMETSSRVWSVYICLLEKRPPSYKECWKCSSRHFSLDMMESSAHFSESVNQLNFLALWLLLWLSRPEFVLRGWLAGSLLNISQVRSQVVACLMNKGLVVCFCKEGLPSPFLSPAQDSAVSFY